MSARDGVTTLFVGGNDVTSMRGTTPILLRRHFHTHDSSKPDFRLRRAQDSCLRERSRIFLNVTATSGRCRCFGGHTSTNRSTTQFSFPSRPRITAPGDHRSSRRSHSRSPTIFKPGSGWITLDGEDSLGFEHTIEYGKNQTSDGQIKDFLHQRPKPGDQSNRHTANGCCLNRDTG